MSKDDDEFNEIMRKINKQTTDVFIEASIILFCAGFIAVGIFIILHNILSYYGFKMSFEDFIEKAILWILIAMASLFSVGMILALFLN